MVSTWIISIHCKVRIMNKRRLAGVSPWIIIGAVLVLAPIFLLMTWQSLDRQQAYTTRLLVDRGDALIRSFEAGARTGLGLKWGSFQLQKLLMETAQQPGIDHLVVTDEKGVILADSDPSQLGETYGTDLDLTRISTSDQLQWRRTPNPEGADTFEIYRQFRPAGKDDREFQDRIRPDVSRMPSEEGGDSNLTRRMVIFVGLDMGPIEAARKADYRHAVMMAAIFLLIGLSGVISLLLAQGYSSARASLSRVRAFSDSLVKNMPMGLIAIDETGRIVAFNQTAESILQQAADDVIGRLADEILPETCRHLITSLGKEKRIIAGEIDCPFADGRLVPLEVIATVFKDGGEAAGIVFLFRDITDVRRLKKEITRNQHLTALGSLAAGVAHEIRNPLSSIKGFATYFRDRYRDNPEDEKTAGIMIREVDRLNRVISQLLDYARPMTMQRQEVFIQDVIRHALRMIEAQAGEKGITLQADLPADIPAAGIDADRMQQVFLNLFLNAMGAMESGGVLSVVLTGLPDGRLRIEVRDTGAGIAPHDLGRIFDPYFTTKPSGTGLGLAIVQKIIDAHNAVIHVASTPGQGTAVTILLPVINQEQGDCKL
ncbi:MAG: histidine kinase [Syntrophus sp. (in: bacteria)]|nr:histidine kinase [Syntrophus sp. (in: bacteria)]